MEFSITSSVVSLLQEQFVEPYEEIDGVCYTLSGVEPSFLSRQFFSFQKLPTVPELIEREANLDTKIEKRRERYACGSSFVPLSQLKSWDVYSGNEWVAHYEGAAERTILRQKKALEIEEYRERYKREREEREKNNSETNQQTELTEEEKEREMCYEKLKKREHKMLEEEKYSKADTNVLYGVNDLLNKKVALWRGDITTLEIDAIVNAANTSLLGGGGVDGVIHSAAGRWLFYECKSLNGCETGQAKVTRGYNLPAKHIIHTAGPIGRKPKLLRSSYIQCLDMGLQNHFKTIAFCGISTGIFGYPLYSASRIALRSIRDWLERDNNNANVDLIIICVYTEEELDCYEFLMPLYFPPPHNNS